ncbi:enoyl-CoA hydratase/isomerase family protein [Undibacterium sp. TJN19]|uniref:enoyl-CoA hydratase/isomerase family protein n=1 Tax=Undibacterium sp. TJN19 TaxID=3413055 RepID=UPI003BF1ED86
MSIRLDNANGLATIVFDNPDNMNVMGVEEIRTLNRLTAQIADDASVRVVVIRAQGKVFGAGGDIASFRPGDPTSPEAIREIGAELNQAILRLHNLPAIVVASVHGAVAGGSMGTMNAADLVVAAKGTRFNMAYAKIGASPDVGNTWFLPRLVGNRKALEWLLFSENFDADQALAFGLINLVVPPEQLFDVTEKLAMRLLRGPRETYARMKRLIYQSEATSLEQQVNDEINAFASVTMTPDFAEGVSAFLGKRAAHFGCKLN